MLDVDAGLHAEQFAGEVLGGAGADAGEVELAGLGFRRRDQFFHGLGRKAR